MYDGSPMPLKKKILELTALFADIYAASSFAGNTGSTD
jgi:hypothetical protein